MAVKRILILVGDYVEDYEAMVPYQALLMLGHDVDTTCPGKKQGETVRTAIHDFEGAQTYSEKRGHNFGITVSWEVVNPADYDALVIPGGRSPEYLRLDTKVIELVKHFFETDKPVAAFCHGPQLLAAAGVLEGRECTAYFALRSDINQSGAKWIDPGADMTFVHTEKNLTTGVSWLGHPGLLRQFVEALGTKIET
jgi:protease I